MKLYLLKNKVNNIKKNKFYDRYYSGDKTVISTTKNIKDKLQQIINSVDIFTNFNDILVFCIYNIEENSNVFNYQSMKLLEHIDDINKEGESLAHSVDYYKNRRDYWKEKSKELNKCLRKYQKRKTKKLE